MNPAQERALLQLKSNRSLYRERYPERWIAVNANGTVFDASRFDLLFESREVDAERFVFAFVSVRPWA